jgi:sugar phosphate permease
MVFVLTFMGYASVTSLRYGWSYSKVQINEDIGVSMKNFGVIDFFYVLSYSLGMVVLGSFVQYIRL